MPSSSAHQAKFALAQLDRRVHSAMVGAVNWTVDLVAGEIEQRVARLTGDLAASPEIEHAGLSGPVVATLTVADADEPGKPAAVEFGTSTQIPQPFFRPACNHAIEPAKANMQRSVRDAIS